MPDPAPSSSYLVFFSLALLNVFLALSTVGAQICAKSDGKYNTAVGEPCSIELDEGEEAKFLFTGDEGDIVGVSFLQCTGEKPQFIYVELELKEGASVFSEATRPGCIMLMRPEADLLGVDVCLYPELGYGESRSTTLVEDVLIDPANTKVTVSNEGNATTTVELVMFTSAYQAPQSAFEIWDEATPTAILEELTLSVDVNFGWNHLPFCDNNRCIVSAYLNEWTADMPTVYICMAEAYGELIYADDFRGGNELSAELILPNDWPYVVTLILSHNATPNSTSPLLAINQEIVYQTRTQDGNLIAYPSRGFRLYNPEVTALVALALGVVGLTRWMT